MALRESPSQVSGGHGDSVPTKACPLRYCADTNALLHPTGSSSGYDDFPGSPPRSSSTLTVQKVCTCACLGGLVSGCVGG